MKEAFHEAKVPCAKGILFEEGKTISTKLLNDLSFPVIIKPSDAFSSRGVIKCESLQDILYNENFTRNFSSDHSLIIEEFLEGPEYSVESITYSGNTHIIQYTEKIITPYPYTVEMGHIQPAEFSAIDKSKIDEVIVKAIKSLKLDNCATHTEFKLTTEGPKIIEIGARLGGDYISSYLTLHSTGVDMDAAVAEIAMGRKPELEKKICQYSGIFYFHLGEGKKVIDIGNWKEVLNLNNVVYANIFVKLGEVIPALTDSAKRSGFVIIKSSNKKRLIAASEMAMNKLKSKIKLK
jgi:carbamoyl-phosphate synthase large subunit